ncbi:MAG: AAA family ATPase [Gammaproteobacteria bacterium]|nr:AAA family ATPase [Gammaproteobacteria bacterium]MBU1506816.1 AAA family ATPase [Gammaproteobacteria bacterium]MBU2121983.1 AAA family ATPase [Gammaproteobacteria bacterium]MBU2202281.1 AAA family ATPase [Gammaproteobacteria bacterium]MBU2277137.1 AAA family ATPase [Gammaproteobacteria bacterium]
MVGEAVAAAQPEKTADERIADCLTNGRSFVLDAGAGAGKTYSLVEGLKKLCAPPIADRLKRDGQQIACITYTNVAKDQVIERIQGNSLVRVSTIHDFLWSTLQPHQQALRQALLDFNEALPPASSRRVDQAELRAKVDGRLEVKYSDRGSKFLDGRIFHDDLLSIARIAYARYDKLARIVASRYPYIFVDEYQDTSAAVVDILLRRILPLVGDKVVLGFFGDKMQNIYHHGEHKGIGALPADLAAPLEVIVKRENRRCSLSVINVLNKIRTDITQIPGNMNVQGDAAYIRVEGAADEAGLQRARELLTGTLAWNLADHGTRELYLTHRLIARKAGFADLLQAFADRGGFAKDALTDGSDRRIAFFLEKVEPLAQAWEKGQIGETLGRLHGAGHRLASRAAKSGVRDALNTLIDKRGAGTVREVLETIRDRQLFPLTDDLSIRLGNNQPILTAEMDETAQEREQADAKLYAVLLALPYAQVAAFARFFLTNTPFATKHGVKGDEFETVLVVLDDSGAAWNFYSFDKYLSGADDAANPERANRSRNVFYVCCSRARKRLAVIDMGKASAAKTARMQALFGADHCFKV